MKIYVSDKALADLNEIENYYFEQGEHLPDLFYSEFEELLIFIQNRPESGVEIEHGYRLFLMKQFPYYVLCEIVPPRIDVIQVVHPKRHPNLKFSRIK